MESYTKQREVRIAAAKTKETNIPFVLHADVVQGLISRLAGEAYADRFAIEPLEAAQPGLDRYRLEDIPGGDAQGHTIRLSATSGVAAAAAFRWYLENRCDSYIGPLTRRMNLPAEPPAVGGVHEDGSRFLYRYFLNYCTFGYTLCFWKWEQWEPFLDWAMLSGYNLILNPVGHEMVWIDTLMRNGYTREEARAFLCGPTFFPWQCMMNLTSWGGPAPESYYEEHVILARRINERLQSFGAGVMLPGFSGMVPFDFEERHPGSHPLDQGMWCDFRRPPLLVPGDPCFDSVATAFYETQMALFGDNFHYFSTDPFHEGGDSSKVDVVSYATGCYEKMKIASPTAVWFFQGWQANPVRGIVNALPTAQVLVGNLRAEDCADGGDNFADHAWLYCCVNNFGGQRLTRGNLHKLLVEPHRLSADDTYTIVGIGSIPEGVENDEILFDALADIAFHLDLPDEDAWLRERLARRYGKVPQAVFDGWKQIRDEVYVGDTSSCPKEASLCARPSLTVDMVTSYSTPDFNYRPAALEEACRKLFSAFSELEGCAPYRFDLTDFVRQSLSNKGWDYIVGLQKAFTARDEAAFNANAEKFLSLYDIQDRLMATDRRALLGPWLELAKSHAHNVNEEAYFEFLARTLITLWGDRDGAIGLRDYAAREWNGMLLDFYKPRWESYIHMLRISLVTGRDILEYNRYDAEYFFTTLGKKYPTEPQGDLREAIEAVLAAL